MSTLLELGGALLGALLDAFMARPIMWTAFFVWLFAGSASIGQVLERNGWRAAGLALLSVSAGAIVLAMGGR